MTDEATGVARLRAARERVAGLIASACARAGRDPADVTLVAVSKTVDPATAADAVTAGLTVLGENRVQEAADKRAVVEGATWHLVGPLQSNKARQALELFDVIESVDSVALAMRLDRIAAEIGRAAYPVLLQVNVDADPAKAGFPVDDLPRAIDELGDIGLDVRGLMTIGRLTSDAAATHATFARLRELSAELRARWPSLGPELSMGMTDDFELAVEEGATIVRVGRALFGERPAAG